MSEEIIENYLNPTINQIRHSIRGIDDSYNNPWDVLSELAQNSVDAIRIADVEEGKIDIEIDCYKKSIKITDNGIGISQEDLPELLKPFSSNKNQISLAIGEKGVGLKFVIFSGNHFKIKTSKENITSEAVISNAKIWKLSQDNNPLSLKLKRLNESFQGTEIEIIDIENEYIFDLTFEQIKFLLLTKTAIGCTKTIWEEDKKFKVSLTFIDKDQSSRRENINFEYIKITDKLDERGKIDLDQFITWTKERDRTDDEKMQKLRDKVIYQIGKFEHNANRIIKYFICFVPKRKVWKDISKSLGLFNDTQANDNLWLNEYSFCYFSSGIHLSVKGMPTGITIDHPSTGLSGYWDNIFILFEDSQLKFDIGRKSVHGKAIGIHKDYAKKLFNRFVKYVTKYVSGDVSYEPPEWNKDETFDAINGYIDIGSDKIKFQKAPTTQEASVAAIFFECIGKGYIQNITPLLSGYRNKYDLYAKWDRKKVVIEFKAQLKNIVRDFSEARKMFDEMDCIVCWEVTDIDKQALYDLNLAVDNIEDSVLYNSNRTFPHATHIISLTGYTNPIFVIDLKKIISNLG